MMDKTDPLNAELQKAIAAVVAAGAKVSDQADKTSIRGLLEEATQGLADLVAAVEAIKIQGGGAGVEALGEKIGEMTAAILNASRNAKPPVVNIEAPAAAAGGGNFSFKFDIETDPFGVITSISGTAKRTG